MDLAVSPLCQDKVNNVDFMGCVPSISRGPSINPCPHKDPVIFAQYLSPPIWLLNVTMTFIEEGWLLEANGCWVVHGCTASK